MAVMLPLRGRSHVFSFFRYCRKVDRGIKEGLSTEDVVPVGEADAPFASIGLYVDL